MFLGIDPGLSGGLAAIDDKGRPIMVTAMPDTEADLFRWLTYVSAESLQEDGRLNIVAALERVNATRVMSQTAAFTFGKGVGVLRMALIAAEIPFDEVSPNVWQKAVGILEHTGARDVAVKKNKSIGKRRAQELFPGLNNITLKTADALLIAEYLRRSRRTATVLTSSGLKAISEGSINV